MKTIIAALMFLSVTAYSEDCDTKTTEAVATETVEIKTDVPQHLKGATYIIRQADGKESVVSADQFKVVPRKQQFLVTKTKQATVTSCGSQAEESKNRFSFLAGYGHNGMLTVGTYGSKTVVEQELGAVGGLQYQRKLNKALSVGVQGQSNKTGSLVIGVDF